MRGGKKCSKLCSKKNEEEKKENTSRQLVLIGLDKTSKMGPIFKLHKEYIPVNSVIFLKQSLCHIFFHKVSTYKAIECTLD